MKLYKLTFVGLILSLTILTSIIFQQNISAESGNLECSDLSGCIAGASCGGPGGVNGCNLNCEQGSVINCGYKPPRGDGSDPEGN